MGFTLMELMIVLAVTAILATLAAPNFRDFILSQRIRTAASDFYTSVALARSEAMKRNAIIHMVRAGSTGTNWSGGWTVQNAGGTVLQTQNAFTSITVIGPASGTLSYSWNGRPLAGSGSQFVVYSPDNLRATRCVNIGLNGMPQIVEDSDENPDNGC